MQNNSARHYDILAEDRRMSRRTMTDATAVLQDYAGFAETDRAEIRIGGLKLPSAEIVGLVQIVFDQPHTDKSFVVTLPTSRQFRARRPNTSEYERFDIAKLHEATVDGTGNVRLTDGAALRAVEVIPARLFLEPSELDWRIAKHAISLMQVENRCYRQLSYGLPPQFLDMAPDPRFLDCSTLAGLPVPPLKVVTAFIRERDATLRRLSEQQIADSLRKFGIRIPQCSSPRQ
jgi:hypothetical protein